MDRNEALADLVSSPGWQWFLALIEREWGTPEKGGGFRYEQQAQKCADIADDALAIGQLRQVMAARKEIHALLARVTNELSQATKDERELATTAPDYSRRGGL